MRILTLTTSQVEATMAGNYTCKPYNSWGSAGTSGVIRVVVEEQEEAEEVEEEDLVVPGLPRLVGAWVDVLEVEVGQQVRLQCQAEGEPQPEVGCCVLFVLQLSPVTQGGLGQRRIRPSGGRSRCDC